MFLHNKQILQLSKIYGFIHISSEYLQNSPIRQSNWWSKDKNQEHNHAVLTIEKKCGLLANICSVDGTVI